MEAERGDQHFRREESQSVERKMLVEPADMMHCGLEDEWRQRAKTEFGKRERNRPGDRKKAVTVIETQRLITA